MSDLVTSDAAAAAGINGPATAGMFSRKPGWPLFPQLALAALALTLLITALAGAIFVNLEFEHHFELIRHNANQQLSLFKASCMDGLISRDIPLLETIVHESSRENSHLSGLTILDPFGRPLVHWQRTPPPHPRDRLTLVDHVRVQGESFGTVKLQLDLATYRVEIDEYSGVVKLILGGILALFATLLIAATQWLVVRPLESIHRALTQSRPIADPGRWTARELHTLMHGVNRLLRFMNAQSESELRFRGLFDNMRAGCLVLRPERGGHHFRIIEANVSARQMVFLDLRHHPDRLSLRGHGALQVPLWEALERLQRQTAGAIHLDPLPLICDGHPLWLEWHLHLLPSGETVCLVNDLTERRHAEDLRQAKEAAEQANALKSAFLASMSHEIRTPMNGVLSMVELLRGSPLKRKQRRWVEAIRSSGQLLLNTINDILDFSRIESGRMKLESVEYTLSEVMVNVLNATVSRAYEKGLEVVIQSGRHMPSMLLGDPFRVQQVLVNLVSNAVKFTEQGEICIETCRTRSPHGDDLLCFTVRDTGMGIPAEQLERIFYAFEQGGHSPSHHAAGTGLGLTISRRLVEAMGGDISVQSTPGVGSTFQFTLPICIPGAAPPRQFPPLECWQGQTALVCQENPTARRVVCQILEDFGFKTVPAASHDQVWDALGQNTIHLVVLDVSRNQEAGINLFREVRAAGHEPPLPFLFAVNAFNRDRGFFDFAENLPRVELVMKPVHHSSLYNSLVEMSNPNAVPSAFNQREDLSWEALVVDMGAREHLCGAHLLVAEDNLVNQEVARESLALAGITITLAENGQEAVDWLRKAQFDGVLMDLQMPVMDGLQATRIIRQELGLTHLPVIAMTAGVLFKDQQRSQEAGMNDFIGKPINLRHMMETLMRWITPASPRPWGETDGPTHDGPRETSGNAEERLHQALGHLDGFDTTRGLERLGGNRKLYLKLLKSFHKAHEESPMELQRAWSQGDYNELRRIAHTLKGIAATLGAMNLGALAKDVEEAVLKQDLTPLPDAVPRLADAVRRTLEAISRLRQQLNDLPVTASPAPPTHEPHALARMVRDLLESCDTRLQDLCRQHAQPLRSWFDMPESLDRFLEQIENYQFEDAEQTFREHATRLPHGPETTLPSSAATQKPATGELTP
ncbi:MAG: response regulator [Magnetococcus sp. WYHC-3]